MQRLLAEEDALLVDVLPAEEYEAEHIAGDISLLLKNLVPETAARLDRNRPVIAYCFDHHRDTSPRAG